MHRRTRLSYREPPPPPPSFKRATCLDSPDSPPDPFEKQGVLPLAECREEHLSLACALYRPRFTGATIYSSLWEPQELHLKRHTPTEEDLYRVFGKKLEPAIREQLKKALGGMEIMDDHTLKNISTDSMELDTCVDGYIKPGSFPGDLAPYMVALEIKCRLNGLLRVGVPLENYLQAQFNMYAYDLARTLYLEWTKAGFVLRVIKRNAVLSSSVRELASMRIDEEQSRFFMRRKLVGQLKKHMPRDCAVVAVHVFEFDPRLEEGHTMGYRWYDPKTLPTLEPHFLSWERVLERLGVVAKEPHASTLL